MDDLDRELRVLLIELLELDGVRPEDIDPSGPLFGGGLGLDSVDALELAAALQLRYGVRLPEDAAAVRQRLKSFEALVALVAAEGSGGTR